TPDVAVVTNIEPDHLDIYGTVEELQSAFEQFMASTPERGHVIGCADSPRVRDAIAAGGIVATDVQTYAVEGEANWRARPVSHDAAGQTFTVESGGKDFGIFT